MVYPSRTSLATGQVLLMELMSSGHISKTVPFLDYLLNALLSRQTESVRDHKFHSGYVIHRWLSQIGGTLFRTCIKLKSKQRESGASQSLHFSQMRSEMRLCLFI